MDLNEQIGDLMKQYEGKPLEQYKAIRDFLKTVCSEGEEFDPLGPIVPKRQEAINGYANAAETFFKAGHVAAAEQLLLEGWKEREDLQLRRKKLVEKAGIAVKLADLYLRRNETATALRWALITQADDMLHGHGCYRLNCFRDNRQDCLATSGRPK